MRCPFHPTGRCWALPRPSIQISPSPSHLCRCFWPPTCPAGTLSTCLLPTFGFSFCGELVSHGYLQNQQNPQPGVLPAGCKWRFPGTPRPCTVLTSPSLRSRSRATGCTWSFRRWDLRSWPGWMASMWAIPRTPRPRPNVRTMLIPSVFLFPVEQLSTLSPAQRFAKPAAALFAPQITCKCVFQDSMTAAEFDITDALQGKAENAGRGRPIICI